MEQRLLKVLPKHRISCKRTDGHPLYIVDWSANEEVEKDEVEITEQMPESMRAVCVGNEKRIEVFYKQHKSRRRSIPIKCWNR